MSESCSSIEWCYSTIFADGIEVERDANIWVRVKWAGGFAQVWLPSGGVESRISIYIDAL